MSKIIVSYLSLVLIFIGLSTSDYAYSQYVCIPTCDATDGKNLVFAGPGNASLTNNKTTFFLKSPMDAETIEFGIFDGDDGDNFWDLALAPLTAKLFTDPNADGIGDDQIGQWEGADMPDNNWFSVTIPNNLDAQTPEGDFRYILQLETTSESNMSINSYKVRTDGKIALFPQTQAFSIMVRSGTQENFELLYPTADFSDPTCFDINTFDAVCSVGDPGCCLNNTTYNGDWKFCFDFDGENDVLSVWDGDFDFGSASTSNGMCDYPDGIDEDTDDPNTPPGIPSFAEGTEAVPQGVSIPTLPPDDNGCFNLAIRKPSIEYFLTSPGGMNYNNINPSGNKEWELFNLSTQPFDPALYDVHVPDLEPGIWCMNIRGLDMLNLNAIRTDLPVLGLDEDDDPVPFDPPPDPEPPAEVPTLSEWGLLAFAGLSFLISLYSLRFRRKQRA